MPKTIVHFQNGETVTVEPIPGQPVVLVNNLRMPLSQKTPSDFINWMMPIWENILRTRVANIINEDT